jgi:hypothetical protein
MNAAVTIIFDIAIIGALGATIFYCLRLSKLFSRMQADRKAFESLIQSLNLAASRADMVIRSLKEAALESAETLQGKIAAGKSLSDELEIMIQAGDNLAERLQTLAEKGRRANVPSEDAEEGAAARPLTQPRSRAEKELLEAIKNKQQS